MIAGNRENRMREQMQRERAFGQCETDRIDQERHVVIHDIDDGVRRDETVFAQGGIEHPDQCGPAPLLREHEVRKGCAGKILRIASGEVLGVYIGKVSLQKATPFQAAHGFWRTHRAA